MQIATIDRDNVRCAFCRERFNIGSEVIFENDQYFCDELCVEEYDKLGAELSYESRYDPQGVQDW